MICDWGIFFDHTVKPVFTANLKKDRKLVFKTNYRLMQVKSITECLREHYAILLTFIKLPFVIKTFVLSIFEWPFHTGFTVFTCLILIHTFEHGRGKTSEIQVSIMEATFGPPAKCYLDGVSLVARQ